jgi:hypothetical protein
LAETKTQRGKEQRCERAKTPADTLSHNERNADHANLQAVYDKRRG